MTVKAGGEGCIGHSVMLITLAEANCYTQLSLTLFQNLTGKFKDLLHMNAPHVFPEKELG